MDLELLSLTSPSTKTGPAISSRQPSESQPCDLTVYVKASLIVFWKCFIHRMGFGCCLPLVLICWQNKSVRQHNTE